VTDFDHERPFIDQAQMALYTTNDHKALRYGRTVKATEISNIEYLRRFERFKGHSNMMPPPSCGRIFMGYLVIRNLGTPDQYETWMSDDVFGEIYEPKS
jgi:hypothetical protein